MSKIKELQDALNPIEPDEKMKDYLEKMLNKMKLDPQYELKAEFGKLLTKHIDSFTTEERKRYDELKEMLTYRG